MTESTETPQTYEELFAHRFTSEDREYQEYVKRPADPPPIVEDWRGRGGTKTVMDTEVMVGEEATAGMESGVGVGTNVGSNAGMTETETETGTGGMEVGISQAIKATTLIIGDHIMTATDLHSHLSDGRASRPLTDPQCRLYVVVSLGKTLNPQQPFSIHSCAVLFQAR
ncbi:RNMT-activating mini protein [Channa argus]|uniref:RNMT-activating mini protein n=1 Tax=Channa argus TaxID=215402 RepID=A0A6G1P8R5_CHAAH|nr:RNMT-activating mini protein [Channa argus]